MKEFDIQIQSSSPISQLQLDGLSTEYDYFGTPYKVNDFILYALLFNDDLEFITVVPDSFKYLEQDYEFIESDNQSLPRFRKKKDGNP